MGHNKLPREKTLVIASIHVFPLVSQFWLSYSFNSMTAALLI
jgi:hypothetical protein